MIGPCMCGDLYCSSCGDAGAIAREKIAERVGAILALHGATEEYIENVLDDLLDIIDREASDRNMQVYEPNIDVDIECLKKV